MLETLSVSLPKKKIYKLILANIIAFLNHSKEETIYCGFLILSRIVEGCADQIRNDLANLVKLLLKGLQMENPLIRGVAIFTISNMAEFLNPEIFSYHQIFLPSLIKHLQDPNEKVVKQAMASIDLFSEYLENNIAQYIPTLIPAITQVINSNLGFQIK